MPSRRFPVKRKPASAGPSFIPSIRITHRSDDGSSELSVSDTQSRADIPPVEVVIRRDTDQFQALRILLGVTNAVANEWTVVKGVRE